MNKLVTHQLRRLSQPEKRSSTSFAFSALLLLAVTCSSSYGATAFVRIKNTDSIAHSLLVWLDIGSGWQPNYINNLAAGATLTVHREAQTGDKVMITWGPQQTVPDWSDKPFTALREDNGSTEWAMPNTATDHTSPYFEFVAITIYGSSSISEGGTYGVAIGRTGSTNYPLLVDIDTLGSATFSATADFTKDWSLHDGTQWVNPLTTDITIPAGVGTMNTTVYVWSDGVAMEPDETATVRVNSTWYYQASWTGTSTTATIAANL